MAKLEFYFLSDCVQKLSGLNGLILFANMGIRRVRRNVRGGGEEGDEGE